jgi:hypothetical protein
VENLQLLLKAPAIQFQNSLGTGGLGAVEGARVGRPVVDFAVPPVHDVAS